MLPLESVGGEEPAASGDIADPKIAVNPGSELAGIGRLPFVTTPVAPISDGQLVGDSGHSEKRHRSTDA